MDEIQQRLMALRDADPAPSSTVDIDRAIRTGRRAATTRKTIGIAVVACLTVAIALGIPAVLRGSHRNTPATPPARTFTVLQRAFTVGTAGGYAPAVYQTGRTLQRAYLKATGSDLPAQAEITLYARGHLPGPGWKPGEQTGPRVNGHATYWQAKPVTGNDTELAWQWQPGAWAFARIDGTGDGLDARVQHIAESVQTGRAIAVRFPFTATKPAIAAQLIGVLTAQDGTQVSMLLAGKDPTNPVVAGVTKNAALDPFTGQHRTRTPAEHKTVALPEGWTTDAETPTDAALTALGGDKQTLDRLAESIRLIPGYDQQSSWVPNPFR